MPVPEAIVCVTDPPYGVNIGAKNRMLNSIDSHDRQPTDIKSDTLSPDELRAVLLPSFINIRELMATPECTYFVTSPQGGELSTMMLLVMGDAGLPVRHVLIWKKNQPTFSLGRLDYDYIHEPILMTWTDRHKRIMAGEHKTSVLQIDRERACDKHITTKPVALYANAYQNHSEEDDVVVDPFAGSGTAFIAAEQLARRCIGIEIEPKYCDVIVERWQNFTGKKAKRSK
mgnify:CR=1 FL=1